MRRFAVRIGGVRVDPPQQNDHTMFASILLAVATISVGTIVANRKRNSWIQLIKGLESNLFRDDGPHANCSARVNQSFETLPPVVERYFRKVFSAAEYGVASATSPSPNNDDNQIRHMIDTLRFRQEGQFNQGSKWLSMRADQSISARSKSLGFVWEAQVCLVQSWLKDWLPKIWVCDAWVNGDGYLLVSMNGVIPIIGQNAFAEHKEELQKGEMMRWLAEAFLTPTALLPEAGIVTWKSDDSLGSDGAKLTMKDAVSGITCEIDVTFANDAITIRGLRPKVSGEKVATDPWGGTVSRFKLVEGMWIPTHMECGWINKVSGDMELYFIADNSEFQMEVDATSIQSIGTISSID
jgi:hypothetical protein